MRVLVCDDDRLTRKVIVDALTARGHDVSEFSRAEAAFEAQRTDPFSLLLIDWVLPRMDGLTLCRAIRELPGGEEPVILLLTGSDRSEHVHRALDAGVSDYIRKPIDPSVLATRLTIAERTVLDRSRRKIAEEAIASSESSFRTLIEGSPDAVIVHRHGRIAYINPAVLKVLGYRRNEDLLGRSYLDLVDTRDRSAAVRRIHEMLECGEAGPPREEHLSRLDGTRIAMEVVSLCIDFDGAPAIAAIARDITERKRMEDQLMLAERLVSVGTLAAGIAHEINNPLAYVMSNLRFIGDELNGLEKEVTAGRLQEIRELLAQCEDGADRVRSVVRDLKSFSRVDDEECQALDVHPVLESAISMAWNEIRHRAQLVREYGTLPPIRAHEAKLGQVFLNLLVNAAQALPVGQAASHCIHVRTSADEAGVHIEVEDTGSGIPEDIMARIFDPFFTTKPVGIGTGLGLSICHNIVTSLDGTIQATSMIGTGTCMRVSLPRAPQPLQQSVPPPVLPSTPPGRCRILIIDDEPGVARSLRRALRNHDVTIALSGREAIEQLSHPPAFDLIFCDLMMPDVSGMDVYEEAQRVMPELTERIVFMTGGAFTYRAKRFLESIHNPWLEKPFDIRQVQALVRARMAA